MRKYAAVLLTLCLSTPVLARIELFPPAFKTEMVATNGTSLHVRVGGKGPAVVLLHGYGETGDMWAPLAAVLVKDHTVVVPDLRGMGLSERPSGSYDKKDGCIDDSLLRLGATQADASAASSSSYPA